MNSLMRRLGGVRRNNPGHSQTTRH
jgi:hypothetical protein